MIRSLLVFGICIGFLLTFGAAVMSAEETDQNETEKESTRADAEAGGTDAPFDFDSMFEEDMLEVAEEDEDQPAPEEDLLSSEGVRWGGRIRGNVSADWSWDQLWTPDFDALDPADESLSPSVAADLFFDARPDPQFRAFGKLKITSSSDGGGNLQSTIDDAALTGDLPEGWTREEEEDGDTVIRDENDEIVYTVEGEENGEDEEPQTGSAPSVDIEVFELFSDFNFDERVFFRFGKHTIKWGVGYFFSPADVLNLSAIDPEEPTQDREGPVSLKMQYPFSINNLYFFLITNTGAAPLEAAVAPKLELVAGSTEIAFAGYYQQALAPRIITMFSSAFDDFDLFGEGVVSLGSDRVFVRESQKSPDDFEDPPEGLQTVLDTYTVDWLPLFSGTIGARYIKEFENDAGSLALVGQYFYNGAGYADSSLLEPAAFLLTNPGYNGLAIVDENEQPEDYEAPPTLAAGDLQNWGRHYVAVSAGWSNIADSDIGFSVFAISNLNDLSGIVTPSLSLSLLDNTFSVGINGRLTFGDPGDEFTNPAALFGGNDEEGAPTFGLTVSVSMGGGSF